MATSRAPGWFTPAPAKRDPAVHYFLTQLATLKVLESPGDRAVIEVPALGMHARALDQRELFEVGGGQAEREEGQGVRHAEAGVRGARREA